MALSREEISNELLEKGFKLINADNYKNLDSTIVVECSEGHQFETTMKSIRHPSFECPTCAAAKMNNFKELPKIVPEKEGYRIIAFDQATHNCGISIYDNGNLVYFNVFTFIDPILIDRLYKIQKLIEEVVVPVWKPDLLVFEDIQQQGPNVKTFKILAMLLGVVETTARKYNIECLDVAPTVWRKGIDIVSGGRANEKVWSVNKVKELTGFTVTDDCADAILIGRYASKKRNSKKLF